MRRMVTMEAARKISRGNPMPKSLEQGFIASGWEEHLPEVYRRAAALLNEYLDASGALWMHLRQILSTIAFYEEAQRITCSRKRALEFMEQWAFVKIGKMTAAARLVMKTGLYRLIPAMGGLMLRYMFGEAAGFRSRPVPDAPKFSVDMTCCPYMQTCAKHGVPELTAFFCRADDITYGNLHPKLIWARTQTLGMGGECCDFRLHVREK